MALRCRVPVIKLSVDYQALCIVCIAIALKPLLPRDFIAWEYKVRTSIQQMNQMKTDSRHYKKVN